MYKIKSACLKFKMFELQKDIIRMSDTPATETIINCIIQCTTLTGVVWIVCTAGPRDVLVLVDRVGGAR